MKKNSVLLFVVVILPLLFSFTPADWYLFESKEHGFKALFPEQPKEMEQTLPSPLGNLKQKIFYYEATSFGLNKIYAVTTSVYPGNRITSDSANILPAFFRGSIDSSSAYMKGTLMSEKEITIQGYPGREYMIKTGDSIAVIMNRVFLVKNRYYGVQIIMPAQFANNPQALKFLDSFELVQ